MESGSTIEFISCAVAAERIEAKEAVVIDVRSLDEFSYGHIPAAVHLSSDLWSSTEFVDGVVQRFAGAKNLIFHCMHSQQRGPTCAKAFNSRMALAGLEQTPKISVLSGGYARWEDNYPELTTETTE